VKKVTLASVFLCLLFPVVALADQGDVMQIKIGQPATLKPQVADRKKLPLPEVATALPVGAGPVVNVEKPWYAIVGMGESSNALINSHIVYSTVGRNMGSIFALEGGLRGVFGHDRSVNIVDRQKQISAAVSVVARAPINRSVTALAGVGGIVGQANGIYTQVGIQTNVIEDLGLRFMITSVLADKKNENRVDVAVGLVHNF